MAGSFADDFINKFEGPFGIVRTCSICGHSDKVAKAPKGFAGRGWGMRHGNKQRGRLIQHVNKEHPEAVAAAKAAHQEKLRTAFK